MAFVVFLFRLCVTRRNDFLGGHLVTGHHGYRTCQRGATQFGFASDASPFPYPKEQSATIDGQLFETVQGICRGLSQ